MLAEGAETSPTSEEGAACQDSQHQIPRLEKAQGSEKFTVKDMSDIDICEMDCNHKNNRIQKQEVLKMPTPNVGLEPTTLKL